MPVLLARRSFRMDQRMCGLGPERDFKIVLDLFVHKSFLSNFSPLRENNKCGLTPARPSRMSLCFLPLFFFFFFFPVKFQAAPGTNKCGLTPAHPGRTAGGAAIGGGQQFARMARVGAATGAAGKPACASSPTRVEAYVWAYVWDRATGGEGNDEQL